MKSLYGALMDERAQLADEAQAIIAAADARGGTDAPGLTDAERTRLDAIEARQNAIASDLQREEKRRERERQLGAAIGPTSQITVGEDRANGRPWGYDTLKCTAAEFVQRSSAGHLALDNPRHPRNVYQTVAFGEFLHAVHRAGLNPYDVDQRLLIGAATGMSEGVPADGGFLVGTDQTQTLLEKTYAAGEITRRMQPYGIGANSNGIAIPLIAESSRADGSRWGGLRGYWTSEAGSITSSKPAVGKFRLDLDKVAALVYVTDEELQDVAFLGSLLSRLVPLELSYKLEDGIVNGSGSGMPLGILSAPCLVSVSKETGQAAKTVVAENIVNMYARMWGRSLQNAVWLINQDVLPQLFALSLAVGTGGAPIFMPAGGLSASPYNTLLGRPILMAEYCATLGTVGDIVLADFGEYVLIDKGGVQQASSIHVAFTTGEQAFRFTYRVNGAPWWSSALMPKNGTNTQSPFVALATRA